VATTVADEYSLVKQENLAFKVSIIGSPVEALNRIRFIAL
jgi:hypothetical protein